MHKLGSTFTVTGRTSVYFDTETCYLHPSYYSFLNILSFNVGGLVKVHMSDNKNVDDQFIVTIKIIVFHRISKQKNHRNGWLKVGRDVQPPS